ncbi:acyltransferase family protein [Nocardiopsis sediminis]|uniref:Acyltransferase family protein n=1 Tax=Nocardiopsis sediminis TaxID=1778267 RepID=A0ABV8FQC1_9ACTN
MSEQTTTPPLGQQEGRPAPPASPSPAPRPTARRLAYIDNLRIVLTVLVVLHHVGVTYGNIPVWYFTEPAQDPSGLALDLLVVFNQAFFMGFFFLISGYFVPASYDRKGPRAFLRGRLVRLGIPLLLFTLLLRPLINQEQFAVWAAGAAEQGDTLPYWVFYLISWDPGPMWFVEVLLVFCLGYMLLRRIRGTATSDAPARQAGPRVPHPVPLLTGTLAVVGFTAGLIALTYVWRLLVPTGSYWPFVGLPTPYFLPQYVLLFIVGALAFRHGWADRLPRGAGWAGLAVALIGAAGHLSSLDGTAATGLRALAGAAWENVFAVGIIIALTVLFREVFNGQGRFGRFLSDQAFGVYFLHPLVLVGLGHALSGWEAVAVVKFAVMAALALPLCWGAAWLLRSVPGARKVF